MGFIPSSEKWNSTALWLPGQALLSKASHFTPWKLHGPPKTVNANQILCTIHSKQLSFRKPWMHCFSQILSIKYNSLAVAGWAELYSIIVGTLAERVLQLCVTRAIYLSHRLPHCWNLKLHHCAFAFDLLTLPPQTPRRWLKLVSCNVAAKCRTVRKSPHVQPPQCCCYWSPKAECCYPGPENPATLISTWKDALPSTLLSSMNFKGKPFYFVWKAWNDFTFWKCSLQHPLRLLLQYDNLLDTVVNTFSPQVLWWVAVCAALPRILAASSQHCRPSRTPIYWFITYKWVLLLCSLAKAGGQWLRRALMLIMLTCWTVLSSAMLHPTSSHCHPQVSVSFS